jgi:hypothetical protein
VALTAVAFPLVALAPAPEAVPGPPPVPAPAPQVIVIVDGLNVRMGVTTATRVADALTDLGVERSLLDRVSPDLLTVIDEPTVVHIARVELAEERIEVELPRDVVRIEDPTLLSGYRRIERSGRDGLRTDVDLVLIVAGEEDARLTLASELVRAPEARVERVGTRTLPEETVWDALARCEASGRWDAVRTIDGRIAYTGGLQFAPSTWAAFKPEGLPALASDATREEQIMVAERVLARQGWGAWPACSERLGLR